MGNSKPELSAEEEDVRTKVIEYYNKMTFSIYYDKKLYSEFYENVKNMKIKGMAIGYCPLKFTPASLAVPNAVHAYAFLEFDAPQKYMGIIIEYGPYSKNEIREDYFFCPFYPFGDGLRFGFFLREMFDKMSFLNRLKSSIIYINNKLTIGEIISNLNSKIPWDKNSYNFLTHNCQDMVANIISFLQAELLDELDIVNKDYELEDMPPVILRTFQNVTKQWLIQERLAANDVPAVGAVATALVVAARGFVVVMVVFHKERGIVGQWVNHAAGTLVGATLEILGALGGKDFALCHALLAAVFALEIAFGTNLAHVIHRRGNCCLDAWVEGGSVDGHATESANAQDAYAFSVNIVLHAEEIDGGKEVLGVDVGRCHAAWLTATLASE